MIDVIEVKTLKTTGRTLHTHDIARLQQEKKKLVPGTEQYTCKINK